VSKFPEKLRQTIHEKGCKSADVAKGTGISPSVLSRYLSGRNKPSSDNILAISHYLNVSPEWLLSSSDAPQSTKESQAISSITAPLLKTIEVQDKLIKHLEKQVKEWEDWKASSKDRHAKGKAKADQAINKNKQKVGFLKRRKPKN
jgi:transcriptional regulator with XRE-family HTH domain